MLKIENLKVNYGGINAVKGISLEVEPGKIVTLIGSNGAGKSTTVRAIIGLIPPASRSGAIKFMGQDIANEKVEKIVEQGISMTPEGRKIFPNLTVLENIKLGAYLRKDDLRDDIEWVYSLFPILKERHWQMAGTLSGGEQQMLCISRALMSKPKLLIMDEPSLGLAPKFVESVFEIIAKINQAGVTILLIEQNANMALQIADFGYVMEVGKITLSGRGMDLIEDEKVKQAYLGK